MSEVCILNTDVKTSRVLLNTLSLFYQTIPCCSLENADTTEKELNISDSGEELQAPNFNILNNSLIQIYKADLLTDQSTGNSGLAVSSPPSTAAATTTPTDGGMEVEKEKSTAVTLTEPTSGNDQHVREDKASVHSDNVEPHPKTHPDSSSQSPETSNNALSTNTEPIILVPSVSVETTGECTELAPTAVEPNMAGKKVSFSTPEVTSQRDFMVGEESKMKPVKRKKSRRHENENSQAKRKKKEHDMVASSQTKSSG